MNRRETLTALLSALGLLASGSALAGPRRARAKRRKRRRVRRRVRRRIRRRIRRRVASRVVGRHRRLVVPIALAIGWELALEDRVVIVHEVRYVQVEGVKVEVVVVMNPDGTTEEIHVDREDTADNTAAQQGSMLAEGDTTTPHTEAEEEVEIEVEVDE